MSLLETYGYKKFWPMRQLEGINADGSKRSTEGFRDMRTGEFHAPEKGWSGEPPELPSGERNLIDTNNKYKGNYRAIFGHD